MGRPGRKSRPFNLLKKVFKTVFHHFRGGRIVELRALKQNLLFSDTQEMWADTQ